MAELFYKDDKNRDFFAVCGAVRSESDYRAPVSDIVALAILRPARSFYLHPREYSKIIRGRGRNLPKNPIKRALHLEILRRSSDIKASRPSLKTHEVAKIIEGQEAPRFYMSKKRAVNLYYELLKQKI